MSALHSKWEMEKVVDTTFTLSNGIVVEIVSGLSVPDISRKKIRLPRFKTKPIHRLFNKKSEFVYQYIDNSLHTRTYLGGIVGVPYIVELLGNVPYALRKTNASMIRALPDDMQKAIKHDKVACTQWGAYLFFPIAETLDVVARYVSIPIGFTIIVARNSMFVTGFGYCIQGDFCIPEVRRSHFYDDQPQKKTYGPVFMRGILSIPGTNYSLDLQDSVYALYPLPDMVHSHSVVDLL